MKTRSREHIRSKFSGVNTLRRTELDARQRTESDQFLRIEPKGAENI